MKKYLNMLTSRLLLLLLAFFAVDQASAFYDANLGRWINRDPIEEAGGINLYQFTFNDAVNNWDLDGLVGCKSPTCEATWNCAGTRPVVATTASKIWATINGVNYIRSSGTITCTYTCTLAKKSPGCPATWAVGATTMTRTTVDTWAHNYTSRSPVRGIKASCPPHTHSTSY
jgi:hypothetical protein